MVLTKRTFDDIKNKIFQIEFENNQFTECELVEIKDIHSSTLKEGQTEPFSLVFQSHNTQIFGQNTYKLMNDGLDEMLLFLVPIGADEKGVRYEAVFT